MGQDLRSRTALVLPSCRFRPVEKSGTSPRTQTEIPRVKSPVLCAIKLGTYMLCRFGREPRWLAHQDLNLEPPRSERGALPLSYGPLVLRIRAQKKRPCFSPDAG